MIIMERFVINRKWPGQISDAAAWRQTVSNLQREPNANRMRFRCQHLFFETILPIRAAPAEGVPRRLLLEDF